MDWKPVWPAPTTRGNTNRWRACISPAPEGEREREKKKMKKQQRWQKSQTTKKGDPNIKTNKGRVLKGTKFHTWCNPRDENKTKQTKTHQTQRDTHRTNTNLTTSQGTSSAQGGGAWATLHWGDTPGDRGTEGSEDTPTTGTAPGSTTTYTFGVQLKRFKRLRDQSFC